MPPGLTGRGHYVVEFAAPVFHTRRRGYTIARTYLEQKTDFTGRQKPTLRLNSVGLDGERQRLPDYDSLPIAPGLKCKGCAWGFFDKNGVKDELGTLNLLTLERVLGAARAEIHTGESVSLNWAVHNPQYPGFARKKAEHRIIDLSHLGFCGHDDKISFCPQAGSHWDAFLHIAHQPYLPPE
jgi:hypothetical protein